MPPELTPHGLSKRHLNYLFAGLFGFPAVMGLILALSSYWPEREDKPQALSAVSEEPAPVFEAMLNPPWLPPREASEFIGDDSFGARFNGLEPKKLNSILNLPEAEAELTTASLPDPAPGIAYGEYVKDAPSAATMQPLEWNKAPGIGEIVNGRAEIVDAITLSVGMRPFKLAGLVLPEEGRACTLLNGEKGDCRKASCRSTRLFPALAGCVLQHRAAKRGRATFGCLPCRRKRCRRMAGAARLGDARARAGRALSCCHAVRAGL